MRIVNNGYLLSGCLGLFATSAYAANSSFEELLAMDITELSRVTVSVASKREEKISQAPSILSIVTAQDIRRYGAKNLKDILNRVTSIQGVGSHFYPHLISMRGQMIGHNNSDIQFLINGRPFRTSWNGGTPYRLLLSFPVDFIRRIEIIRGPGSALYGTGAFTGVIDIITKTVSNSPSKNKTASTAGQQSALGVTYGSMNSNGVSAALQDASGEFEFAAGLQLFKTDGWDFEITDEAGTFDSLEMKEDNQGLMVTGSYHGLRINVLSTEVKLNNIGGPPVWPGSEQDAEHLMADLGYTVTINRNWSWENHLTANKFDFSFLSNSLTEQIRDSDDLLFETTLKGRVSDQFEFLLGGTYEDIEGTVSPTFTYSSSRYSIYQQLDLIPTSNHKFTLGLQANKVKETESDISPRFAYVTQFNANWGLKLLHSKAFRSAVATERFLPPGNAVVGDPSLDPEIIYTSEAQLFLHTDKSFAAVTLFKSKISGLIDRMPIGGGLFKFTNTKSEITSYGVELESKLMLSRELNAVSSVTYQDNEDEDGNVATLAPNWMAKLGFDLTYANGIVMSIFDSYFADPQLTSELNSSTKNVNPDPEAYHLVTAKFTANMPRLLNKPEFPDTVLSVYIDNLLDEEVYYPEINRKQINSIPIYSGRAFYTTLEVHF